MTHVARRRASTGANLRFPEDMGAIGGTAVALMADLHEDAPRSLFRRAIVKLADAMRTRAETRALSSLRAAVHLRGRLGGPLRLPARPCSSIPETPRRPPVVGEPAHP